MSYSADLWDQFEAVAKRSNDGRVFSKSAHSWYEKRAELERSYAKKLLALAKTVEIDFGSSQTAWASVKAETEALSRKHTENADRILESSKALVDDLKTTAKPRDKLEAQGKKALRDLRSAEEKELSCKQAFEKLRHTQDQTKDEYERATFNNPQSKLVDKLSKKLKADTKRAASADAAYSDSVQKLASTQTRVYREEMPRVLDELQRIEEQRIATVRSVLLQVTSILSSTAADISSAYGRVQAAGDAIDPRADVVAFVNEKKTGAAIPPPATYEPYDPATGKCEPKSGAAAGHGSRAVSVYDAPPVRESYAPGAMPSASSSGAAAASSSHSAGAAASSARESVYAAPVHHDAPHYLCRVRALYTYEPQDPSELAFNEGDIINVLQKDDSGWWQGELHGEIKVFPFADWCEMID